MARWILTYYYVDCNIFANPPFFKTIHTLHKYSKAIHPNQAREDAEYYENTFKASIHIESYIL